MQVMTSTELKIYRLLLELVGGDFAVLDKVLNAATLKSPKKHVSTKIHVADDLSAKLEELVALKATRDRSSQHHVTG